MKVLMYGLMAGLFIASPAFATTKLSCITPIAGDLPAGPIEIDMDAHIAYRFTTRETWPIVKATAEYITMMKLGSVGGSIAVLNLNTGALREVSVGLYCSVGTEVCTHDLAKIDASKPEEMVCRKNLLDQ